MKIIIVGTGAIGKERIRVIESLGEDILCVIDPIYRDLPYKWYADISEFPIKSDWIFVCTPHDTAVDVVKYIKRWDDKVKILVEKPYLGDLPVTNIGLNYRFYKGIRLLLKDCEENHFGDIISVNMILALGDPPGSEKSWRLNPQRAGRGSMLDPGIHIIDLARIISKNTLSDVHMIHTRGFWNTGIEEESHLLGTDMFGTIYNLQSSICRWRNNFRIEVNGTDGYGIVEGRGGNYGRQIYKRGKRWGWLCGKSQKETEELVIDYCGEDSFYEETKAILYGCDGLQPATYEDNNKCLKLIL